VVLSQERGTHTQTSDRVSALSSLDPVLVIEDDADLRTVMCHALEAEGLPVESAPSGMLALYRAAERQPSVVLLDLGLPDMVGEAVANGLRRICGDAVPIIVVSASDRTTAEARGVHADGYVHKPFDMDDLITLIRRVLGRP
jgi:two-component system KDP operon response regulator KdpE